jgi:23S rRNA (cytosine1962-C5)-methyltransferase
MNKIFLKKGRDEAVKRQHPWIFSGAVGYTVVDPDTIGKGVLEDGDLVEVCDSKKQFLAVGYYNDGSIVVRVLSFKPCVIDDDFWYKKLQNAFLYRQKLELTHSESTNCYRLIHAEGDCRYLWLSCRRSMPFNWHAPTN